FWRGVAATPTGHVLSALGADASAILDDARYASVREELRALLPLEAVMQDLQASATATSTSGTTSEDLSYGPCKFFTSAPHRVGTAICNMPAHECYDAVSDSGRAYCSKARNWSLWEYAPAPPGGSSVGASGAYVWKDHWVSTGVSIACTKSGKWRAVAQ